jgi:hypothetical protein
MIPQNVRVPDMRQVHDWFLVRGLPLVLTLIGYCVASVDAARVIRG